MVKFTICAAAFLCFQVYAIQAFACKCEVEDRDASYFKSKAVFYGKSIDGGKKLKVLASYKGTRKNRKLEVVVEDSCDSAVEDGKTYVVYASKISKKTVKIDTCSATQAVDFRPLTGKTWSYGEELPYGTSKKLLKKHTATRARIEKTAIAAVRKAAKKCDKETWFGKDKVSAMLRVRFDVTPDGAATPVILRYEAGEASDSESCFSEALAQTKFKKFSGMPLSVRTYWMLNRVDKRMKQEKRGSQVIPFKSSEESNSL